MKLSDHKAIEFMVKVRGNVLSAITQAEELLADYDELDCNGKEIDEHPIVGPFASGGFHCMLGKYKDFSGPGIDMTQCYVGKSVAEATLIVLQDQLAEIDGILSRLGVEVDV